VSRRGLEGLAAALLLLLALVPRAQGLLGGFDREFEGYQGAFFAIAAVNYERLGLGAAGGYPVLNVDLPGGSPAAARERGAEWFVYQNHPPTTALLAWAALATMGPEGWGDAWRSGAAPEGVEAPLRFPFLLLHLASLALLWRVARLAFGPQVALLTLALGAYLPVSAMYGAMVNLENPSLPCVLLAVLAYGAFVREGERRALAGLGLAFLAGCAVTFAPAFFLPPLVLRSASRRRWREAGLVLAAGGLGCALPVVAHALASKAALAQLGQRAVTIPERARELFQPLFDGSLPLGDWLAAQVGHAQHALGLPLAILAVIGLALSLARGLSSRWNEGLAAGEWPRCAEADVDLATPLATGAGLFLFAFYRHTGEEQWSFWLYVAPAAALLAARALHALSLPLQRLRGGTAPLVLVTGTVMLLSLARYEGWRGAARAPGPRDDAQLATGPDAPLPSTVGRELAELLPPGSVGLHPTALGLNLAASWYAWRTLLPVSSPEDPLPAAVLGRYGLGDAPRYLVLPEEPPAAAGTIIEAWRAELGAAGLSSDAWTAWRR